MNIFEKFIKKGFSCLPCKDKIPAIRSWQKYMNEIPSENDVLRWNGDIALICGKVNGGLVCIDFDVKNGDKYRDWLYIVDQTSPSLLGKLVVENTPSGGYHVLFRTELEIRNIKLAKNKLKQATIETRGEGGYFVCSPSVGYSLNFGTFTDIQTLTIEETKVLLSSAKSLNELFEDRKEIVNSNTNGLTPFDDYDSKMGVKDILVENGWTFVFEKNNAQYFKRPGKKTRGISASWNAIPNRFYCFTTSTTFENEQIYKSSAVYAILYHGGNYSRAAQDLSVKGFGTVKVKIIQKGNLISNSGCFDELRKVREFGYPKGKTVGWANVDEFYSVIKGMFTVVTGYPSHGKSSWVDAMLMNMALKNGWKFAVFSPENYPIVMHKHKLVELQSGISLNNLSDESLKKSLEFIEKHFFFIDALESEQTLDMVLETTKDLIDSMGIDGLVIDPWNELELNKPKELSTTEFIGKSLRISRKFARRHNIHLWIVAHPTKIQKDKSGNYPVPELYDIEGSAHWRNKADNGICIYRHFDINKIDVNIQKIKYKYSGKMGQVSLSYDIYNGRYKELYEREF